MHSLADQASFARWPVPEDFWDSPDSKEAVQQHDFGLLVRAFRRYYYPPISQLELSGILALSQGQVSRIESGKTVVTDLAKLTRWSRALGFSDERLWFDFPTEDSMDYAATLAESRGLAEQCPILPGDRAVAAPVLAQARTTRIVGSEEISTVLEMVAVFRQLDNRFGGSNFRSPITAYLKDEVEPMLRVGRFAPGLRGEFQCASVELNQLVGWMAYDAGDDIAGRQYLRRALDISSEAGDDALSAEMLAAISHQAAYAGRGEEALDFAISAKRSALRSGSPALQAESAALEAQGYAIKQDVQQCLSALRRAERAFSQVSSANTPPWLIYFDRAYMAAKFAHALRSLGEVTTAERFARVSLEMSEGYERGKLFNTAMLAGILADSRKIDEAASCILSAVRMADQVRSVRAWRYLDDVRIKLYPFRRAQEVASVWQELAALKPFPGLAQSLS